jgi:hypothetical protein
MAALCTEAELEQLLQEVDEIPSSNDRVGKKQRDHEEESRYIIDDLKSGKFILLLQETPRVKMSRCKAWSCTSYKRTGKRVIKSHYRFMLKDISVSSSMGMILAFLNIEIR